MTTAIPPNVLQRPKNMESPGTWVEPEDQTQALPLAERRDRALVEEPALGPILFVVLVVLGGVAGGVLTGSPGAGVALVGVLGVVTALLVASL